MKRRDWWLLGGFLAAALALWAGLSLIPRGAGQTVVVESDGEVARYAISEDRTIALAGNWIVVSSGEVRMEWADCPDLICVKHAAIDQSGEVIVCLPHRVVVRIE